MAVINNITNNLIPSLTRSIFGTLLTLPVINSVKGHFVSFQDGKTKEQLFDVDGSEFIEKWTGISGTARDATQTTQTNKFEYIANGINGKPAVRCAIGDLMTYDGTFFVGTNYSVFIVEQRTSDKISNFFIAGTNAGSNANLTFGYLTNGTVRHSQQGAANSYSVSIPTFTTPIPRIHSITHNSAVGTGNRMFRNGAIVASDTSITSDLSGYTGSRITNAAFEGELGELIMYDRLLSDAEILSVHQYLSKKWGIVLT